MQSPDDAPRSVNEPSSPPALPVVHVPPRSNRRRIGLGLLAVLLVAGATFWWQFIRLDSLEQQLVGTWTGSRLNGANMLFIKLRTDRSGEVVFSTAPVGPMMSGHVIELKDPTWRQSQGHLLLSETVGPWVRVELFWYRLCSMFTGGTGSFRQSMDLGEIRDVRPDSFELGDWHMKRVP